MKGFRILKIAEVHKKCVYISYCYVDFYKSQLQKSIVKVTWLWSVTMVSLIKAPDTLK